MKRLIYCIALVMPYQMEGMCCGADSVAVAPQQDPIQIQKSESAQRYAFLEQAQRDEFIGQLNGNANDLFNLHEQVGLGTSAVDQKWQGLPEGSLVTLQKAVAAQLIARKLKVPSPTGTPTPVSKPKGSVSQMRLQSVSEGNAGDVDPFYKATGRESGPKLSGRFNAVTKFQLASTPRH